MRIAIPSYKRSLTIKEKTLNYLLNDCGINPRGIDVFVADLDEFNDYAYLMSLGIRVIVGKPTLRAQRNFIDNYYDIGECILQIDDDIKGIYKKIDDKNTELFTDLLSLAKKGFDECLKNGTKIWGISAVHNPFFMKDTISTNLKYIIGCFWGQIITKDKSLSVSLEDKEDFERTIIYFDKFKSVVRFNGYAPVSNFYTEKGGMQETRTKERVMKSAIFLSKKYPNYCSINTGKKNKDFWEIKLNHRAK